jgi:hypothetical protein
MEDSMASASAICEAIPPRTAQIVDGRRAYRSQHMVTTMNDTGEDVLYNVEAIMFDSLGHSGSASAINVVAPPGGSGASGPYFVDFDANLFSSGSEVEITCETHVTGGLSAGDRQVRPLTIE